MDYLIAGALIVVVVLIALAMLADRVTYLAKGNCYHKWCEWGEPIDEKQYRICEKCKMVERRFL
jgi:hypothetical protein